MNLWTPPFQQWPTVEGRRVVNPYQVVEYWEAWCGPTLWSKHAIRLIDAGGHIAHWCGVPRSHSAIPLTFVAILPDWSE